MPIVMINTNVEINDDKKEFILCNIAQLVANLMKKPIADVMVLYSYHYMIMANSIKPVAFVDLKYISRLDLKISEDLCSGILDILNQVVDMDPTRLYLNFFEVSDIQAWRFIDGVPVCPKIKNNK